jgi:hypothetical protein
VVGVGVGSIVGITLGISVGNSVGDMVGRKVGELVTGCGPAMRWAMKIARSAANPFAKTLKQNHQRFMTATNIYLFWDRNLFRISSVKDSEQTMIPHSIQASICVCGCVCVCVCRNPHKRDNNSFAGFVSTQSLQLLTL